jgi:hypothetical protein
MSNSRGFDPINLFVSSTEEVLGGLIDAFRGRGGDSKTAEPSSHSSDAAHDPEEQDDYLDDDGDDGVSSDAETYTSAHVDDDIPAYVKLTAQKLTEALVDVPGIQSQDIVQFCSDRRNWPLLKFLAKVGIAVIGVATVVALISALADVKEQERPAKGDPTKNAKNRR